jgi:hypothetical protein
MLYEIVVIMIIITMRTIIIIKLAIIIKNLLILFTTINNIIITKYKLGQSRTSAHKSTMSAFMMASASVGT